MTATTNRRAFPRANYPCSLTVWQNSDFGTIIANTSNIGAGGLLVYLNQGLMIGAKIEIKIDFTKTESFECIGLVLRCQESQKEIEDQKNYYAVAIIFEGLDEAKVARLKTLVEKLLTYENKD
jgi:hypothetical protein